MPPRPGWRSWTPRPRPRRRPTRPHRSKGESVNTSSNLTPPAVSLATRTVNWLLMLVVVAFLAVSFREAGIIDLHRLVDNSANTARYLSDYLDPNFGSASDYTGWDAFWAGSMGKYVAAMWQTVSIALWATSLSIILAVPLSFLCSRNIAPAWVVQPMRAFIALLRAFPDIVLGTAFVAAVGLGPLAGVLALTVSNAGTLAKLFSEAVENIENAPVEGVRATGGSRLHEIVWGVIPQVAALWTSFALYRFESNARSATVLGLIGAGGIGQLLFDNLNGFDYRSTSAISLVIVAAVTLIDILSQQIRKRLL
ncbi:MAG: phosphonate ABC transporter, permease protein PhnE [Asticcacaulis sp.]|nr:phosphonate ABC transporter, permease protein PhnE [Asticcacaulis sp.]